MDYTHRWERPQTIAPTTFNTITEDFRQVLPALEAAGSPIANAYGFEDPELTADYVRFNGVANCGHTRNPAVRLAGPMKDAFGIGDNCGMGSALPYRTCNGDCSYESLWFDRSLEPGRRDDDGIYSGFCKTAFRPYDLAVTVFLMIAKHHLGELFHVGTDGDSQQWIDAQMLCQAELRYSLSFAEVIR